jgi:hypothetical protein
MSVRQDGGTQVVSRTAGPNGSRISRVRALVIGALCTLGVLAAGAPIAQAGLLVSSAQDCDAQVLERPFLPWLDPAQYTLAPAGTFENGTASWTLVGGAAIVPGNETFYAHGEDESSSLSLPSGSSATSASMCVGIEHPTLRIFARNRGGLLSTLKAEVLYEDAGGETRAMPIGLVTGGSQWKPSLPMPIVVNLLPLLPGEHTAVAFRFSTTGSWQIDDVYVDPYRSR